MTAFLLTPGPDPTDQIAVVGRDRIDLALGELQQLAQGAPGGQHVHECRKRCKEARGLARLARPGLGPEFGRFDRRVRDAARLLAGARDAQVALATLERLRAARPELEGADIDGLRAGLEAGATERRSPDHEQVAEAHELLTGARDRIERWAVPPGFGPLAAGLGATYHRGRRELGHADRKPTDERLHEWRKSVKHLWYQIRLLEPSAPSVLGPLVAELDRLADALGDHHDLAVLVARVAAEPSGRSVVDAARADQRELRASSLRLGATLYAESRKSFVGRVATYWRIACERGPERTTLAPLDGA